MSFNCLRLFVVAMAMVVIGDTCVQSITAIRTISRLYCCHGDGSDGRHVCSKYHGHTNSSRPRIVAAVDARSEE